MVVIVVTAVVVMVVIVIGATHRPGRFSVPGWFLLHVLATSAGELEGRLTAGRALPSSAGG